MGIKRNREESKYFHSIVIPFRIQWLKRLYICMSIWNIDRCLKIVKPRLNFAQQLISASDPSGRLLSDVTADDIYCIDRGFPDWSKQLQLVYRSVCWVTSWRQARSGLTYWSVEWGQSNQVDAKQATCLVQVDKLIIGDGVVPAVVKFWKCAVLLKDRTFDDAEANIWPKQWETLDSQTTIYWSLSF